LGVFEKMPGKSDYGKGDERRPSQIGREEEELNWLLYEKKISSQEWRRRYKELQRQGKITRSGRVVKEIK